MRIVLDLNEDLMKRLKRIRERQEVKSNVEVIARALSLYELLTDLVAEDCRIVAVNAQGESENVDIK